jgi:hypothetical protein
MVAVTSKTRAENLLFRYTTALPPESESLPVGLRAYTRLHCIRQTANDG